jgi:DNA repair photolyase
MEYPEFERHGLKVDKERVLTYSKLLCPLNCTYCFVDEMTQEQEKGVSYLSAEQVKLLQNLPEQIKLVMLGCDTEFFQDRKDAVDVLNRLKDLGKDISVITKLPLSGSYIKEIALIARQIVSGGNIFSFSISIPCLSDASIAKYEPNVPTPLKRVETLKTVFNEGLSTMVAIRPLLPDIEDGELDKIIELTKDFTIGYYSGPLYLKQEKVKELLPEFPLKPEAQPHWMLEGNTYQEVTKEGQMEYLASLVRKSGKQFFEGAADGVEYVRRLKQV